MNFSDKDIKEKYAPMLFAINRISSYFKEMPAKYFLNSALASHGKSDL